MAALVLVAGIYPAITEELPNTVPKIMPSIVGVGADHGIVQPAARKIHRSMREIALDRGYTPEKYYVYEQLLKISEKSRCRSRVLTAHLGRVNFDYEV